MPPRVAGRVIAHKLGRTQLVPAWSSDKWEARGKWDGRGCRGCKEEHVAHTTGAWDARSPLCHTATAVDFHQIYQTC